MYKVFLPCSFFHCPYSPGQGPRSNLLWYRDRVHYFMAKKQFIHIFPSYPGRRRPLQFLQECRRLPFNQEHTCSSRLGFIWRNRWPICFGSLHLPLCRHSRCNGNLVLHGQICGRCRPWRRIFPPIDCGLLHRCYLHFHRFTVWSVTRDNLRGVWSWNRRRWSHRSDRNDDGNLLLHLAFLCPDFQQHSHLGHWLCFGVGKYLLVIISRVV